MILHDIEFNEEEEAHVTRLACLSFGVMAAMIKGHEEADTAADLLMAIQRGFGQNPVLVAKMEQFLEKDGEKP